jgi:hypothetical protein
MTARKDNRLMVQFYTVQAHWGETLYSAGIVGDKHHLSVGYYSRRASAKRGMLRFLRRIGADPAMVRWEGESCGG